METRDKFSMGLIAMLEDADPDGSELVEWFREHESAGVETEENAPGPEIIEALERMGGAAEVVAHSRPGGHWTRAWGVGDAVVVASSEASSLYVMTREWWNEWMTRCPVQ